ncbi:uncharacterized protein CTRU02_210220 [Colletotrichum truncatum]|uniref:Uncharacterized protein n=1 Tax=Colletotrichum truncatum TaxID=5467 RepID=A0ACC3YUN1_COLTU|nr:uncharacterized protein CTRU02_11431 [Colletotrichum truncatum]KAF6785806.1 hypothetical protein CTRU02_11431 [Colletotrichum truncatum]
MSQIMPPIPRIFFSYIQPLYYLYRAFRPLLNPTSITAPLVGRIWLWDPDNKFTGAEQPRPVEALWAHQNSSSLFMLALLTYVIMFHSTERKVVRGYVLVSALADFPHWAALANGMGSLGHLWDFGAWSAEMRSLIFFPMLAFAIKVGYLSGVFGDDRSPRRKAAA